MSEVLKGHVVACLRVQMFLAIWTSEEEPRKKQNACSLLYYSTVYVQIDGNILIVVACPIPWSGNGASVEFLEFLMATDLFRGQGLYIDY